MAVAPRKRKKADRVTKKARADGEEEVDAIFADAEADHHAPDEGHGSGKIRAIEFTSCSIALV